ncbi:hypothetical protein L1987_62128 [Smallanthus sonchifolius]|uniref:Uncharacterized protein n=1 Tax=Smallanthus sonchifolius TaxID=185202 RepID=A0ACB9C9U4_9ASTR|nr:hypothetical protein L1987_62128 [Smallanthus sonchifolius]
MPTASSKFRSSLLFQHLFVAAITFNFISVYSSSSSSDLSVPHEPQAGRGLGLRGLKSFKEKATGTNITFDCSPSGPCVPCLYSEKKDETYRCSETGYRIPMRCVKIETPVDEENETKKQKDRNLLEDSSNIEVGPEIYVTYRSCIPAVNEEKLSVLGFEALMLLLLISSSFVIFRHKGSLAMPGAMRLPTNPRF